MAPHRLTDFIDSSSNSSSDPAEIIDSDADTVPNLSIIGDITHVGNSIYEAIAIVGIGCRLPGEIKSASNLWELLMENRSGHSDIPASRWNIEAFYHPNGAEKIGTMNMKSGYFIHEDLRKFENSFFGINNIEATFMDPQQRKLLEVVYECLENAGVPLEQISNTNIGTFVGSFTLDYWMMQTREPDYLHRYHATGMGTTILSNRISHALNLLGPSFTLDTGCSASIYSLHQACSALDAGECDAAIVAASNLIQSPEQQLGTMKAGVLSPTGTCHTFDNSADGYGRADGLGALYLKKLSKAIADGDVIRSIIRGTAVNSNGKTQGISLPSADGQEAVMRKAYAKAGISDFSETQYIECHGTGTPVGDPIEVEAVSRVFSRGLGRQEPLLIGSVKTNLGHSEAASGLSSIIKATLALENGCIPATIGVKNVNPKIKTEEWGVKIVTENTQWPMISSTGSQVHRIGVNSFGYGGANGHAILESAEDYVSHIHGASSQELSLGRPTFLIPLSASTSFALEEQATRLVSSDLTHVNVVDLAYTLGTRRSKLAQRSFALVSQKTLIDDLQPDQFQKALSGNHSQLPIAFVFTGQGAQWPQMGKELIEGFPSFRRSIQDLDAVLNTLPEKPSWSILEALLSPKETSKIHLVTRSQPVCTAVQIALVQLLAQWGIKPDAVLGHSSGEICAAYSAGRLTAAQAITVAYYRGYIVNKGGNMILGAMMAVGLNALVAEAEIKLLGLTEQIKVACVNSPESVTISGDTSAIELMCADLTARGIFARILNTNGRAYHSHHMLPLGSEYQELLEKYIGTMHAMPNESLAKWVSSVYAESVTGKVLPSYWRKNLESPVLFGDALEHLLKGAKYHLVEIGPHSALEMPIKQTCKKLKINDTGFKYTSALSRGKNSIHCVLSLVGNLFLQGHDISFAKVNYVETPIPTSRQGTLLVNLPPYPWTYDEQILFNESRSSRELRNRKYGHHDLLGIQTLGGNGLEAMWRNTLRVKDVSWVEGHKLVTGIIFPGAGYIAMAMEAICQVTGTTKFDAPSFVLRHVNIMKACQMAADPNNPGVELFTTLRPMKLSGTTNSDKWYDFEITTYDNEKSTTHATGMISLNTELEFHPAKLHPGDIDLQDQARRNWYEKFDSVGLCFGPTFQSLEQIHTDRQKQAMFAQSTVKYLVGGGAGMNKQSDYIIHPITIDSMLQTALIASSAGSLNNLTCMVPISIEHAQFKTPRSFTEESPWLIDAVSESVGPASIKIAAELHDGNGQICGQLENVSAIAFQGARKEQSLDVRHPIMRVVWKPDITKIRASNAHRFSAHLATTAATAVVLDIPLTENLRRLAALIEIVAHKNPRIKILELGSPISQFTRHLLGNVLRSETAFPRYCSYARGYFSADYELFVEDINTIQSITDSFDRVQPRSNIKYDLVIFPNTLTAKEYTPERLAFAKSLLNPRGAVIALLPSTIKLLDSNKLADLSTVEISIDDTSERIILGNLMKTDKEDTTADLNSILVVERGDKNSLNDHLILKWTELSGRRAERTTLSELTPTQIKPDTIVVCTIELNEPILRTMNMTEMINLKIITDNATKLIWLTGGAQMDGYRPDFAMVSGFSRSLVLEQPSLRFFTYDIDNPHVDQEESIANILATLEQLQNEEIPDLETVQQDGVALLSRFVPEETMNETFRQKQGGQAITKPLGMIKSARLTIKDVGQFDTFAFKEDPPGFAKLRANFVEVDVKSIGLNAKDVFVYSGKVNTHGATSSLECAGVITRVGSSVSSLRLGDRVVVMAPGHFATMECFPEWACEKLRDDEDYNIVSTIPLVFATALYGLHHRAGLCANETVLIHSGAGGVGIAAIQIAQLSNAEIFTTVSTEEKKKFLVERLHVKRENIFNSRDSSFLAGILAATNGKGVDVVLNSLTGDLLHNSWRACARFGRFVEIGKRDLNDAGRLDMQTFSRNVTFTAFDVSELCDPANQKLSKVWEGLLRETMSLYRSRKIKAFDPLRVFDASEISQAFRHFSIKNRMGKIAVSFQDSKSLVQVLPTKYDMKFHPHKTYLLSGCLGGIGRSITKYMTQQGAKKFVFIGRSGLDKKAARQLVKDLEDSGASVKVIRGDVSNLEDVKKCVDAVNGLIGGVVQAAMGLDEALFTVMSNESWHTSVKPKVQGSWNLHNAIKGKDSELDFFLLTSSVAGSVGTATESNYTSANSFLDNFAKYRRRQGLPATSIGLGMISEIGYLHENPEIEAVLLRKGITPIKEEELLSIIDITLSRPEPLRLHEAHVLTGLETQGMKKLRQMGFEGTIPTLNDPRASILASSLDGESDLHSKKSESGLPPALAECLEAGGDDDAVLHVITTIIVQRLANLILVQAHKIDKDVTLSKWGMDSMLVAEFRTWFFMAFTVDIPFILLLGDSITPVGLGEIVKRDMLAAGRFVIS